MQSELDGFVKREGFLYSGEIVSGRLEFANELLGVWVCGCLPGRHAQPESCGGSGICELGGVRLVALLHPLAPGSGP